MVAYSPLGQAVQTALSSVWLTFWVPVVGRMPACCGHRDSCNAVWELCASPVVRCAALAKQQHLPAAAVGLLARTEHKLLFQQCSSLDMHRRTLLCPRLRLPPPRGQRLAFATSVGSDCFQIKVFPGNPIGCCWAFWPAKAETGVVHVTHAVQSQDHQPKQTCYVMKCLLRGTGSLWHLDCHRAPANNSRSGTTMHTT